MQQRGTQSRRAREAREAAAPPPASGPNVWAIVAIIAIIAATAGWTTVAVMAMNASGTAVATSASPAATDDDLAEEPEPPDEELSHDVPALEALLPTAVDGGPMTIESWDGATDLSESGESGQVIADFLTSKGKQPTDLGIAQAQPDASVDSDLFITVARVDGVDPVALRDAYIASWKVDFPELTTSETTVEGIPMVKGSFGEDVGYTFWFEHDGTLYAIDTSNEADVPTALAALPNGPALAPGAGAGGSEAPTAPSAAPSDAPPPS